MSAALSCWFFGSLAILGYLVAGSVALSFRRAGTGRAGGTSGPSGCPSSGPATPVRPPGTETEIDLFVQ